ncbi:recombinase family protein [Methylobacterium sp. Leaf108]|uniref:recombinase family protein n=1 Tax=Methylobacterium sp. Leaf108 TaxID=1736256 RepID=UPI0006F4A463|nr:recombinase family protein [Methylobacterium sp. Leaf108]KQP53676.1 hypothetical protein ASF39_19660 [Methylobacterium sp. Leaf108]
MPPQLKKAIAYIRVSTERQGKHGNGLDLQVTAIQEFARQEGFQIVDTFRDATSGMGEHLFSDRPGVMEACELSRVKRWPIIVDGLDRFARNTVVLEQVIADRRLTVISCRRGESRSHATIMAEAARAQREGELISENTRRALQKLKEQGVRLGNPTNLEEAQRKGVESNKARANQLTRELAPVIQELRQGGKKTAQAIAEGLNQQGHRTPRGELWKGTNVRRLIKQVDELAITQRATAEAERYKDNPDWGAFA